jgi:hypothetical protein
MSENLDAPVCGKCDIEDPPNAEVCQQSGAALTLTAALAGTGIDDVQAPGPAIDSADATYPPGTLPD